MSYSGGGFESLTTPGRCLYNLIRRIAFLEVPANKRATGAWIHWRLKQELFVPPGTGTVLNSTTKIALVATRKGNL
jgi:hypothetical protein